jgi:S1-C subfamily serine protease
MIVAFSLAGCTMKPDEEKSGTPQPDKMQAEVKNAVAEIRENTHKAIVSEDVTDFLGTLNTSLAAIAEAVKPSIVNIATKKTISMKEHPFGDFFNDPLFKKFFKDGFGNFGGKRKFKTPATGIS